MTQNGTKRIMCFGDSLTWGWKAIKGGTPVERYPSYQRWTGILSGELGSKYEVIEEGLSGRTTNVDDPTDSRLNGSIYLPAAIASHMPLDLVVIMLGTNDAQAHFNRTVHQISVGMSLLLGQIRSSAGGVGTVYPAPRALLIAPPPVIVSQHPWFVSLFAGAVQKTSELSSHYEALASYAGVEFINAGTFMKTNGVDGVHFDLENNKVFASHVKEKIFDIFGS